MSRQWRSDDTDRWIYAFGDGHDGNTYAAPANEGCSGTTGTTTLTLAAAGTFANGDLILIHQSRGTGAGGWELNKIVSGGGTTTLTLAHNLQATYTDSGSNQAQCLELKEYDELALSGTNTVSAWDGSKGGIMAFFAKKSVGGSGTLALNGGNGSPGSSGTPAGGTGGGFTGGNGNYRASTGVNAAQQGEGTAAAKTTSTAANGNGGGGGNVTDNGIMTANGGSGGNGAAGTGGGSAAGGTGGSAGAIAGHAELTTAVFGGGGGGAARGATNTNEVGGGGSGGGLLMIFGKSVDVSGLTLANLNGGNGGAAWWPGGGGAGGSCLIKCQTAVLGTNKITASGGTATSLGSSHGPTGAVGRIHIDYSGSYTGSTTPTLNARLDSTITNPAGGGFVLMMV